MATLEDMGWNNSPNFHIEGEPTCIDITGDDTALDVSLANEILAGEFVRPVAHVQMANGWYAEVFGTLRLKVSVPGIYQPSANRTTRHQLHRISE